ncbi:MAG: hypothetical protein CM15mV5_0510 [uncultured marine virus]|nr:MAG: hypothetical protein CM15mV5_0510 [uncultured marine virus]
MLYLLQSIQVDYTTTDSPRVSGVSTRNKPVPAEPSKYNAGEAKVPSCLDLKMEC